MSEKKNTGGLGIQVIAGALAAVTAAVVGSRLGVAGTVLGAGLASVLTTVGAALYLRSMQRVLAPPAESAARRPPRWAILAAGGVLAFVLGMLAITGLEWVRGEQLSGGQGTTIGGIVRSQPGSGPVQRPDRDGQSTGPAAPAAPSDSPATTGTPSPSSDRPVPSSSVPPTTSTTTSPPTTTSTQLPTTAPIEGGARNRTEVD